MEKAKTILLLASSLTLLSCQVSQDGSSEYEAPTGSEVTKEELNLHYAKALEAMSKVTTFGAKVSGEASYSANTSYAQIVDGQKYEKTSLGKIEMKDLSASFAMQVDENEEVKASMSAAAKYAFESNASGTFSSTSTNGSKNGSISLKTYYDDETLYIDGTGLSDLLSSLSESTSVENLKIKENIKNPEIDWSQLTDYLDKLSEIASDNDYIQAKNGTYSFVYTLGPDSFAGNSAVSNAWSGEAKAWLSFTEEGFTELGLSGALNYSYSIDYGDDSANSTSIKTENAISANLKASFSYGGKVTVEEVSDPDSYLFTTSAVD